MIFQVTKRFYPIRVWLLKKHSDAQKKKIMCATSTSTDITKATVIRVLYDWCTRLFDIVYRLKKQKFFFDSLIFHFLIDMKSQR